jgi:preprotein translocase subunit SecF
MSFLIILRSPNILVGSVYRSATMNIIKNRYIYFGISLLVIIPGIIALILWQLPLGIDFTGGSLLEVSFETGSPV